MKHRLTVRRAILLAVMLGLLLPALLVGAIGGRLFYAESLRERADEALNQYGEVLALGLQEPLWSFNPAAANKLIEAVMRSPDVYRIEVRDASLGTFVQSEKPERRSSQLFHAVRTIHQEGRSLGSVKIEISDALVVKSVRSRLLTLAITLAAQIVLGTILITVVLERRLVKPLLRVGTAARRLASGALDDTIPILSNDEIGSLEERLEETRLALRRLLETVEDKNRQLETDLVERRRAETAAQRSETRLRALVEQSPIAIIEIGLDGSVREWNTAAERIFGWTRDEAIGRPIDFIVMPGDTVVVERLFSVVSEGSGGWRNINDNLTRSGERITCQWYNNLVRDADGIPERIVTMAEDVTEARRTEQEVSLLARVVSRTTNIVIITDAKGCITWTNEAFTRLTGWRLDEVRGTQPGKLLQGSGTDPAAQARLHDAIANGMAIRDVEVLNYSRSGDAYWVQLEIQPIHDEHGRLIQFMAVETDITERKQAELRIRESRRMLQTILDTIPVRVFWKDRESRFLGCNAHFAADAGKPAAELVGQTDADQRWALQAEQFVADDFVVVSTGKPRINYEEAHFNGGQTRWLRVSKVPLRDGEDRIIGILGVYEDVTERKLAEMALASSEQRLRALIDNAPFGAFEYELDPQRQLVLITSNPAADAIFGIDCALLRGTILDFAFPMLEDATLANALRQVAVSGERYSNGELDYSDAQGRSVLEVFAFQTGKDRVAVLFRDVSELHRAAEGMRRLAEASDRERDPDFFPHLLGHLCEASGAAGAVLIQRLHDAPLQLARYPEHFEHCTDGTLVARALAGESLIVSADLAQEPGAERLCSCAAEGLVAIPIQGDAGEPDGSMIAFFENPIRNPELTRSLAEAFAQRAAAELSRQKTLSALRESEARFSLAFHLAPIPMTVARLGDGLIFDANRAFCELFGYTHDEVANRTSIELDLYLTPEDRAAWVQRLVEDGYVSDVDVLMRTHGRRVLNTRIWARMLVNKSETPTILVNILDVTEQQRIRRELEELNRTLESRVGERTRDLEETLDRLRLTQNELVRSEKLAALGGLVAGVAHELNTPIGNSLMVASTLRDATIEVGDSLRNGLKRSALEGYLHEADSATDILLRNLHRAGELISSFKQVAVDQTSSQRRQFALAELISEIVLTLQPTLKKTPFVVTTSIPEQIRMDSFPGPLGQVVTNLITNAIIHGLEGRSEGGIAIAAERDERNMITLSVSDEGSGIAAEHLARIFDPFFTTKRGGKGSGLGLHIVHNIVTGILGGQIAVESQAGKGTRFRICIPAIAPAAKVPETA